MRDRTQTLIPILAGILGAAACAQAGELSLARSTIDGGGGVMAGGGFTLRGSIGQHDASPGPAEAGSTRLYGGFWGPAAEPCAADVAPPFGVLDLADINAFTSAFLAMDPLADIDGSGVFDLADINTFVASFSAGCP